MEREPILTSGAVAGAVTAVLSLLVAFGVPLTDDQRGAILGLAPIVAALGTWALARRKTTPWSSVLSRVRPDGAVETGPAADEPGLVMPAEEVLGYTPKHAK